MKLSAYLLAGVVLSTPAFAWDNTLNGNGQIVDSGGMGWQQAQKQRQQQTATGIGNGGGGGGGGGGGNGSAVNGNVTSTNTATAGNGGGGGNVNVQASDRAMLSYGMAYPGGARCPGTGANGGGSGLVAVVLGYTSYSKDCAAIERAELYARLGDPQMATALLRSHFDEDMKVWRELHPTPIAATGAPIAQVAPPPARDCVAVNRMAATGSKRLSPEQLAAVLECG